MCLGGFGLSFVFHVLTLYQNSRNYEMNPYNTGAGGTSADMLYMIILGMIASILIDQFIIHIFYAEALLFTIVYVYSRRDPTSIQSLYGFKFKTIYLPWMFLLIKLVMNNPLTSCIVGKLTIFIKYCIIISSYLCVSVYSYIYIICLSIYFISLLHVLASFTWLSVTVSVSVNDSDCDTDTVDVVVIH